MWITRNPKDSFVKGVTMWPIKPEYNALHKYFVGYHGLKISLKYLNKKSIPNHGECHKVKSIKIEFEVNAC